MADPGLSLASTMDWSIEQSPGQASELAHSRGFIWHGILEDATGVLNRLEAEVRHVDQHLEDEDQRLAHE